MTQQLETRSFEVRDVNLDAREVTGIAVPYDTVSNNEMFSYGAAVPAENTMLFWEHDDVIGRVTAWEQTSAGLMITARFTEGVQQADEAYALVKDGAVRSFSVGFRLLESHLDATGVNVVDLADVREVSVVPLPWYETATIKQVREEPTESVMETETMTDSTPAVAAADLEEVREAVENVRREMTVALEARTVEPMIETRSAGEIVHAIAAGDEQAIRTYTGATTGDSVLINAWIGDLTRLVEQAAPLRGVFGSAAIPGAGNYLEYASLTSNSVDVDVQAAEGDDLGYGEVVIDSHTAPVKTFGGYSQLSKQVIERSSIAYVDHVLRAQAIAAGVAINGFIRSEYELEHAAQITAGNTVVLGTAASVAAATYQDWLLAAIDAQVKFQAQGLAIDALVVDKATFKSLLTVESADGRPVFLVTGAGNNNVGTLNVQGLAGELAGIPVVVDAGLTADAAFVSSKALRFYGSPTVSLQQDNVINLSRNFSVYMYGAVAHELPAGIVPVVID
jgi:HK97 family phage prohead protease/HK97 family phage major capsid protein